MQLFRSYLSDRSSIDIITALNDLSIMLHTIHDTPVILIFEDYDHNITSTDDISHKKQFIDLVRKMLVLPASHPSYIDKIIITGVYYDPLLDIFPKKTFTPFTILDTAFSDYFGFTEDEIDKLLESHLKQSPDTDLTEQRILIKQWYDGYKVGEQKIYNPSSIISCLFEASMGSKTPLKIYWRNEDDENFFISVFNNIDAQNKIFEIMKAGYLVLNTPISNETKIKNDLCALLLHAGYLTPYENEPQNLVYVVPNKEIKRYFYDDLFVAWIDKVIGKDNFNRFEWVDRFIDCLEDKDELKEFIQVDLLSNIKDYSRKNEAFFQIYTGGIALISLEQAKTPKYKLVMETANNFGKKTDGIFIPLLGESSTIIIHELKVLKAVSDDKVQEKADDAIWQILSKKYMDIAFRLNYNHFLSVIIRGIVFYTTATEGKWSLYIKELQFSYDDAKKIDKHFSEANGKILSYFDLLSRDKCSDESTQKARKKLGSKNIDELIQKIIQNDPSLINIDKSSEGLRKRKNAQDAKGQKIIKKG